MGTTNDADRRYRLVAESQAWPLVGRVGFERRILSLSRDPHAQLESDTDHLSDELTARLRAVGRSVSLEIVRAVRDQAWFPRRAPANVRLGLHEHFARVAEAYIQPVAGRWLLQTNEDVSQLARRYRWLSLMLPTDTLVAAYCGKRGLLPQSTQVEVASPLLTRSLERGVAETHCHMGGGYGFPLAWSALSQAIAQVLPDLDARGCRSDLFRDVGRSQQMLYAAAIMRVVLAKHLAKPADPTKVAHFDLAAEIQQLAAPLPDPQLAALVMHAAGRLLLGRSVAISPETLRLIYKRLLVQQVHGGELGDLPKPKSLAHLRELDPLARYFAPGTSDTLAEAHFQTTAMQHLRYVGAQVAGRFATLFWQYLRVRVRVFRYLTLDAGTTGLEWFSQAYGRISALRGPLEHLQAVAMMELQSKGVRLDAIEFRTSPEAERTKVISQIRSVATAGLVRAASQDGCPEVGLTLHFIKKSHDGSRYHGDPASAGLPSRYGRWVRAALLRAFAVEAALRAYPQLLLICNSLDIAGRELSMPTWPTLFPLRYLRDASRGPARWLSAHRPTWRVHELRLTYHAGEDFRRLSEGLRRVHEVMRYGPLRPGDRLGHGLALFVPPERWAEQNPRTYQPVDGRLDDLLWELERYRTGDFSAEAERLAYVEAQARLLLRRVYQQDVPVHEAIRARHHRHQPERLHRLGYPAMLAVPQNYLGRYLSDRRVFLRGRESVEVETTAAEVRMLEAAQRWLRSSLAVREVTVEANPSSNQLISDLDCVDDHPALAHSPDAGCSPLCSINTDDPLTFATSLADEYAHVYFSFLRSGLSTMEALTRIEDLRTTGLRSRFTYRAASDRRALGEVNGRPGRDLRRNAARATL